MSDLIEKFRETHQGVPPEKLVDTYFTLLEAILENKKNKDFDTMLMNCQMSLSLLEPLIGQTKKEYGSFDISGIPAIEIGSTFWAVYGAKGQLLNLKEVIDYFPELEPWKEVIEQAFTRKDVASKIYEHVKEYEGCLQKELKKALEFDDGRLISTTVHYMESVGKIERSKVGNTYSLSVR